MVALLLDFLKDFFTVHVGERKLPGGISNPYFVS